MERPWLAAGERRSDEALRRLVGMIFEGHLPPGSRLPAERELAAGLGVSRATLRDAINRLAARGYIECRAKSGNYVCSVLPRAVREPIEDILEARLAELSHVIDIRKVLEIWIAGNVARCGGREELAELGECLRGMRASARLRSDADFARHREADIEFHGALARATRNPICIHLMSFLQQLISRSITTSRELMPNDYGEKNLRTHEGIYAAIRDADPEAAERAMQEHFEIVERSMPARKRARRHRRIRESKRQGSLCRPFHGQGRRDAPKRQGTGPAAANSRTPCGRTRLPLGDVPGPAGRRRNPRSLLPAHRALRDRGE